MIQGVGGIRKKRGPVDHGQTPQIKPKTGDQGGKTTFTGGHRGEPSQGGLLRSGGESVDSVLTGIFRSRRAGQKGADPDNIKVVRRRNIKWGLLEGGGGATGSTQGCAPPARKLGAGEDDNDEFLLIRPARGRLNGNGKYKYRGLFVLDHRGKKLVSGGGKREGGGSSNMRKRNKGGTSRCSGRLTGRTCLRTRKKRGGSCGSVVGRTDGHQKTTWKGLGTRDVLRNFLSRMTGSDESRQKLL